MVEGVAASREALGTAALLWLSCVLLAGGLGSLQRAHVSDYLPAPISTDRPAGKPTLALGDLGDSVAASAKVGAMTAAVRGPSQPLGKSALILLLRYVTRQQG